MNLGLTLGLGAKSTVEFFPPIAPSAQWNGTAGTGFGGSNPAAPSDPTRTTAKPVVRLLDPPNQYFTDALDISVMAFANNAGTLIGGIDRVRFHFEGNVVEVSEMSLRSFTRYDGSTYQLPCYSVRLQKPASTAGIANLFIEAIPADGTMQSRVLGPLQFSPVATKHDWVRTVGLTGSGADFTNASLTTALTNAINAAKAAAAQNPRLTFISSGTSDLAANSTNYTPQGYMTLECAPGVNVTFTKASYTTDAAMLMRTFWNGLWFRGAGFTFNMDFVDRIVNETQAAAGQKFTGRSHVVEGVKFTRASAPGFLIRKNVPNGTAPFSITGSAWVLDCLVEKTAEVAEIASLLRGNIFQNGFSDVAKDACAVVGNTVTNQLSEGYRNLIPAMTVQYTGAGATADLSLTGNNSASSRTFTARVNGASVGTFTVLSSEAAFIAGTNYNVSNVVNWINSLPDWTATLQDDTRFAAALCSGLTVNFEAFTNLSTKGAPLQLYTAFDLHPDFYQKVNSFLSENVLIYGNRGLNLDAQLILIGGTPSRDYLIANNAMGVAQNTALNINTNTLQSQFAQPHSNTIFVHNSFPQQAFTLRTGTAGANLFNADAYCLFANNSLRNITWSVGVDADMVMKDNHLHGAAIGTGHTGEVKAGDETNLYVDFLAGDFRPAGALLTNLKAPVLAWDMNGRVRAATDAVGAIRI